MAMRLLFLYNKHSSGPVRYYLVLPGSGLWLGKPEICVSIIMFFVMLQQIQQLYSSNETFLSVSTHGYFFCSCWSS